ncbi:hypothetical protein [Winogradskyella sp. A3E31]|uniref:hypothetical protein n=1 Tax=Winogradskyella sp. A3E31 TaxID=3349637 RepID=UPI00398A9C0E
MKKENLNIKSTGFKVPKNYFEELDDKVLQKIKTEAVLPKAIKPGFKVPDSYFDTVDDTVFSKLNKESKVISLVDWKRVSALSGIAAALLICAAIFFNTNSLEDELSVDLVESYFESQDLDTYELAQLLSDADFISEDLNLIETSFEEENIETYLLENSDIEYIIE